jgi:hypothetical protein
VDLDEHLVEMSLTPWAWPATAQSVREGLPELAASPSDRLVADDDTAGHHHLFDLAETEREGRWYSHTQWLVISAGYRWPWYNDDDTAPIKRSLPTEINQPIIPATRQHQQLDNHQATPTT